MPLVGANAVEEDSYCVEHLERLYAIAKQWQDVKSDTEGTLPWKLFE
jgi:hypothetical protein